LPAPGRGARCVRHRALARRASVVASPPRAREPPCRRRDDAFLGARDGADRGERATLSCRGAPRQRRRPGGRLLVEEKSRSGRGSAADAQPRGVEQIIKAAIDRGASDLHIKAGDVFRARIDGKLVPLTKQRLTPEQTRAIALRLLPSDEERARIDRVRDYDCSWGAPGIGRFRVNILRQRSSFMIVLRVIPFDVPSFDSLKLPPVLTTVAAAEG